MANISVTEEDFEVLFSAAHRALNAADKDEAEKLDKICRKVNATLANKNASHIFGNVKTLKWKDVPSVFEGNHQ